MTKKEMIDAILETYFKEAMKADIDEQSQE